MVKRRNGFTEFFFPYKRRFFKLFRPWDNQTCAILNLKGSFSRNQFWVISSLGAVAIHRFVPDFNQVKYVTWNEKRPIDWSQNNQISAKKREKKTIY